MPEGRSGVPFAMTRRITGVVLIAAWGVVAVFFGATMVHGGSMEPSVAPGDIVVYRRSAAVVGEGDIVYFAHPEWPQGVVHRVVEVMPDGAVRTRGDANGAIDREAVPRRRIHGVATFVVPSGKAVAGLLEAVR